MLIIYWSSDVCSSDLPALGQRTPVTASISIGSDSNGNAVLVDVEELLATRLLDQGNSGSGKSHLLRRLLEESAARAEERRVGKEVVSTCRTRRSQDP